MLTLILDKGPAHTSRHTRRALGAAMEGRQSAVGPGQLGVLAVWAYLASDTLTIRWSPRWGPTQVQQGAVSAS